MGTSIDTQLTQAQQDTLFWLNIVACILSLGSTIFFLLFYACKRYYQNSAVKLVCGLMTSSTIYSIACIVNMQSQDDEFLCQFGGFLKFFSANSVIIWFIQITYISYSQLKDYNEESGRNFKLHIFSNLVISFVLAIIPLQGYFFGNNAIIYEESEYYMWCVPQPEAAFVIMYYGPVFFSSVVIFYLYNKILKFMRGQFSSDVKAYRDILLLPLVFYVTWFPEIIDEIAHAWVQEPIFFVILIHIILNRLQGVAFVFCYWKMELKKDGTNIKISFSLSGDTQDKIAPVKNMYNDSSNSSLNSSIRSVDQERRETLLEATSIEQRDPKLRYSEAHSGDKRSASMFD